MTYINRPTYRPLTTLRWLARIWAVVSIAVVTFLIGEGFPFSAAALGVITTREWLMLLCFPLGMVIGFIIAWQWEISGGIVVVVSFVAFYLIDYFWTGSLLKGPWFALLFAPGLLFLLYGFLHRQASM